MGEIKEREKNREGSEEIKKEIELLSERQRKLRELKESEESGSMDKIGEEFVDRMPDVIRKAIAEKEAELEKLRTDIERRLKGALVSEKEERDRATYAGTLGRIAAI